MSSSLEYTITILNRGSFPFCSPYDSEERCAVDGSGLISFGHKANTQCWICGGGYTFKNDNVIVNATNKTCLDETDWQSNNFTCWYKVDKWSLRRGIHFSCPRLSNGVRIILFASICTI